MNKKINIMMMGLTAMLFAACSPETIDGSADWTNIDADQLQLTATPVDNVGNKFFVSNKSAANTQWVTNQLIEDPVTVAANEGVVYFTTTGQQTIKCLTTNNGTIVEKSVTVNVTKLDYLTDKIKNRLCLGKDGAPTELATGFDPKKVVFEQEMTKDGKPGNRITIKSNTNPVLCTFKWGSAVMDTNIGTLFSGDLGKDMKLTVETLDCAGQKATYELATISADDYSFFPEEITKLTGYSPANPTATKTWTLASGNNWGNGAYGSGKEASWWATTAQDQNGSNGKMTFNFSTSEFTKVLDNDDNKKGDKSGKGTFKIDFAGSISGWTVAKLRFEGASIVFPYIINEGDTKSYNIDLIMVTDKDLYLCAQHTDPSNGEGTFWHFVAVQDE